MEGDVGRAVIVVVHVDVIVSLLSDAFASFCSKPIEKPSNTLVNSRRTRTRTNKERVNGVNGSVTVGLLLNSELCPQYTAAYL